MGDKGGKKDKEKNLQQQVKKHQLKEKEGKQPDKAIDHPVAQMPSQGTGGRRRG